MDRTKQHNQPQQSWSPCRRSSYPCDQLLCTGWSTVDRTEGCSGSVKLKEYTYENCDFKGLSLNILKEHGKKHRQNVIFPCAVCEFHGKSMDDLITHKRTTHTVNASCSCTVCSFEGKGMDELRNRMDIHTMYVAYTCDECYFNRRSNVDLRHHLAIHGISVTYQCTLCYF